MSTYNDLRTGSIENNTMLNMLTLSNKKVMSKTIKKIKAPSGKKQSFNFSVTGGKLQNNNNNKSEQGSDSFIISSNKNSKLINSDLVPS